MIRSTRANLRSQLGAARREIVRIQRAYLAAKDKNAQLTDALEQSETHNANLRTQLGQQLRHISDEKLLRRAIHDLHERLAELTRADHGHDLPITADTGREVA